MSKILDVDTDLMPSANFPERVRKVSEENTLSSTWVVVPGFIMVLRKTCFFHNNVNLYI